MTASGRLILEPLAAVGFAVAWLSFWTASGAQGPVRWLMPPAGLAAAAWLPYLWRSGSRPDWGLQARLIAPAVLAAVKTCLWAFPLAGLAGWLWGQAGGRVAVSPVVPVESWPAWILYQFLYVAVAEELFFRGYVLGTLGILLQRWFGRHGRLVPAAAIAGSAAVFALAHVLVLRDPLSVVTFFPGLIFGWLFWRTRSLFAPILFHGLANTAYLLWSAGWVIR